MSQVLDQEALREVMLSALEETFESSDGIYPDTGTSLFDTLATITAAEASRPVGGKCATLAAQVGHVIVYLDAWEGYLLGQGAADVDWGEIWRTVAEVTPEEWSTLNAQLAQSYQRVSASMAGIERWDSTDQIRGALGIVVHTAYHLGEIRQALCTLR